MLSDKARQDLLRTLGHRIAFHTNERLLYDTDVGVLPGIAAKQIQSTPDVVVQPENLDDLTALLNVATEHGSPLTPRGSGTAGYGGAVPVRGGIVIDFHRMGRIIDINKSEKTVTVECGVVWNDLERELEQYGLSLRLYPGSAVSSTVAGWLSNGGGVGIGSFEYGRFADNVLEVDMVTPRGVHHLTGDKMHLVDGTAGTTGLIYQVKLKVRDLDEDIPVLGAFRSLSDMQAVFEEIRKENLSLWEVGFKDPLHIKWCHEAATKQAQRFAGHSVEGIPAPPERKFLSTFVYPRRRHSKISRRLHEIITTHDGEILDAKLALFEWAERFYPVRLKALGPSLIQSEAIIPTARLPELIDKIRSRVQGVALDGTLISQGEEVAVLTSLLDDERRRGFPMAYSSSLIAISEAIKLGGKAYAIGMYLIDQAEQILGKAKLVDAERFKREFDPDNLLNPGKVFPDALRQEPSVRKLNRIVRFAKSSTGALRLVDKLVGGKRARIDPDSENRLSGFFAEEALWDAYACSGCGFCRSVCPEFDAIGWESASPRGKFRLLREYAKGNVELDERMAEMFFVCTTCQRCNEVCQVKAHIEEDWSWVAKPTMLKQGFRPPVVFQRQAYNILTKHNPSGAPQERRSAWVTSDLKFRDEGNVGYFAGCSQSFTYLLRNLPINALRVLNRAGIEPVYLGATEWCCGGATLNVGCADQLSETIRHNIEELNRRGIKTLITSCSSCRHNLSHVYPILASRLNLTYDLKVRHITEVVSELLEGGGLKSQFPVELRVTYHDPCHLGRSCGVFDPPRKILSAIPGLELVEMSNNRENSSCCGKHIMRYPRLGLMINGARTDEAILTGASAIVCSCSTCENNFRMGVAEKKASLEVIDIMDLVAETVGLPRLSVSKISKLLHGKNLTAERR
jgi:Fe-S oxidoreductase/FAD/FMN-containing dehydrogenase